MNTPSYIYVHIYLCTSVYFTLKSCKHFSIVEPSASLSRFIRIYFRFQIKNYYKDIHVITAARSLRPQGPGHPGRPPSGTRVSMRIYNVFTVQILNKLS